MPITLAFFLVTFQLGGVFIFHSNVGAEEFIRHESDLTDHDGLTCPQVKYQ